MPHIVIPRYKKTEANKNKKNTYNYILFLISKRLAYLLKQQKKIVQCKMFLESLQ